ncbi:MAG: serine/threonine-protein kinase [Cyanobacteria bacterium J06629_19]
MNSGANSDGRSDAASPLGDRYKVIRELGRGSFGQTYLAENLSRHGEHCVVKEFIPQLEDKAMVEKAKALFSREANVLYQLNHRQIPEFHELLQVENNDSAQLFLVQEYIEGPTFQQLLEQRQRASGQFRESEITQLLYDLLPVLSHIHSLGIVHRDISPDNLISRRDDGLPVLIDFGSVKEIAGAVRSQLSIEGVGPAVTHIGKVGYVPQEQLSTGNAGPTSDLYGLAATLLVLANGKNPQTLHDTYDSTWKGFDVLSPKLGAILEKMLQVDPAERFQSAEEVLVALNSSATVSDTSQPIDPAVGNSALYPVVGAVGAGAAADAGETIFNEHIRSEAMAYEDATVVPISEVSGQSLDPEDVSPTYETTLAEANVQKPDVVADDLERKEERQALIPLLVMLGTLVTLLLFAWFRLRRPQAPVVAETPTPAESETVAEVGGISLAETQRRDEIRDRISTLGLGENTFTRIVDQLFYTEYPNLRTSGADGGRKALTSTPADEPLRIRWDNIAMNLLSTLEGSFSDQSLAGLSNYSENDRTRWESEVNSVNVGSRTLYDLADAKFFSAFPGLAGEDFLQQPTGQIYYAIADDKARAIANGNIRENVSFTNTLRKEFNARLAPGEGRVYLLDLTAGQLLRLNLNAPTESTLSSLYLPNPTEDNPAVFADSEQTTWSGGINQSGFYEFVVVNTSNQPIDYQLTTSVDNVSTSPPVAPEQENLPSLPGEQNSNETTDDSATTEADGEQADNEQADNEQTDNEQTDSE